MIKNIFIKNIVLIEKLSLELDKGLIVFSGETGAGKSIILNSLSLALGRRSEQSLLRNSASQGIVSIEFEIREEHPSYERLKTSNLIEGESIILKRVLNKSGKSKAFINDCPVTINFLREIGSTLLEIHGQNEKIGLLDPSSHLTTLDKFGDYKDLLNKTKDSYKAFERLRQIYFEAEKIKENKHIHEEDLQNKINLIRSLNLKEKEEQELSNRKNLLNHYEKIFLSINEIFSVLNDDNENYSTLASNAGKLENILSSSGNINEIKSIVSSLNIITIESKEILNNIHKLRDEFQYDEKELEKIEYRLFDINNIARKLNTQPELLNTLAFKLEEELTLISKNSESLDQIRIKLEKAKDLFKNNCQLLSTKRKNASKVLEELVNKELVPLKLQDAKFRVNIFTKEEDSWNASGSDITSFFVRLNKGTVEGEIHKISSGGELSRLMLAINLVLAGSINNKTLIFDEVDSGVSGAVAASIGKRLQDLSKYQQILVITHLPQVACKGKHHFRSFKITREENTFTHLEKLNREERAIEIAKMISGENITEEAKMVANNLLQNN